MRLETARYANSEILFKFLHPAQIFAGIFSRTTNSWLLMTVMN